MADRVLGLPMLISDEGFRFDGRRPKELRQIRCKMSVYRQADGSAYIEQGNTKVLATVYGPHEVHGRGHASLQDEALINCQYSQAVFSAGQRKRRPRGDMRSLEVTQHLEQTFKSVILTSRYPRSQIDIYVEVLQDDGSTYSVCVNAATLALVDAGVAVKDIVCACTATDLGLASGEGSTAVVDINVSEHLNNMLTLTYLPKSEKIVQNELIGRLHQNRLRDLIAAAVEGCQQLHSILEATILEHVKKLAISVESSG